MSFPKKHIISATAGLALLSTLVYALGLSGGFVFDDIPNIVKNPTLQIDTLDWSSIKQIANVGISSQIGRPVSMLTFWLNCQLTGLAPYYFKLTNLFIHTINGILVFWLTLLLISIYREHQNAKIPDSQVLFVSILSSAIWVIHPLNLTGVLYIVQRMTSLSALFVLAALICYLHGRRRLCRANKGLCIIITGYLGFGALSVLSKENGLLLPLLILVIENTLFSRKAPSERKPAGLRAFLWIAVILPSVCAVLYVLANLDWVMNGYRTRSFTLSDRLLTEARVLWLYLEWALVPTPSHFSLFHDDIPVSRGLFTPWTTFPATLGLLAATAAAIALRRASPLIAFSVLWYLAGHSMESSFISLEPVYEHRNYLPLYGPVVALTYGLCNYSSKSSSRIAHYLPIALLIPLAVSTMLRAYAWSSNDRLFLTTVRHHPDSPRANYQAGISLGTQILLTPKNRDLYYTQARRYFEHSAQLDHTQVRSLFALILLAKSSEQPIAPSVLPELQSRLAASPFDLTIIQPFNDLVDWITKGVVSLPESTVVSLFNSAIGNRTISTKTRAILFSILSRYYLNHLGKAQKAVNFALAAVHEYPPDPLNHLNLAALAIKFNNLELAKTELNKTAELDPQGMLNNKIRELRGKLNKTADEYPQDLNKH